MIPSNMPVGIGRGPKVGEPSGPGIILPWPNHLDARMESIYVRLGTLEQNRFRMSPGERRDLRKAIWNDVLIVDEQVAGLADNRGTDEFTQYYIIRDRRYRTSATDFQSATRTMMGTFQRWLEQNNLLLMNEQVGKDYAGMLIARMDKEEEEDKDEEESDDLAEFDEGLDELEEGEDE